MNRKHYIALAKQFASARKLAVNENEISIVRDCAERVAQVCREHNSAFQTSKFMTACGF